MKLKKLFTRGMQLSLPALLLILNCQFSSAQTVTANTQSTHDGFFYSFWNDGQRGSASMTLGAAGNYSTTWNNVNNFTAGKGWAVGKADRTICFSGSFNGGSNGFLAVYGWTKEPLIEYYVCENHGSWTPPGNTSDIKKRGTYTCDGSEYTAYTATRTNMPSIIGDATFQQYWSIRTNTRSSGTVTFSSHVAAWKSFGMNMGTIWDYQIMESEGYQSTGSSNITVSECSASTTTVSLTAPLATDAFTAPATISLTAAAKSSTGTISKVEFYNGTTKLGEDASSPYSYSWASVAAGSYSVTVVATDNKGLKTTSDPVTVKVFGPQTPYGGTARAIPGVIEFEEYDEGGNGNAYYDSSPGSAITPVVNYRTTEDVDIESCTDAGTGYNLGYTVAGEWLEYTVDVKSAGKYDIDFRVACESTGRTISLTTDGKALVTDLAIPSTTGWQIWQTVTVKDVVMAAGKQVLRLTIGATDYVNLNKMTFTAKTVTVVPTVTITEPAANAAFTVGDKVTVAATASTTAGTIAKVELFVNDVSAGSDITAPYTIDWTSTAAGTYTLKVTATDAAGASSSSTVSVTVAPAGSTIKLIKGWNLIGYPYSPSKDADKALASVWANVLVVKDADGFWDQSIDPMFISLRQLQYGRGYFVKVSQDCTLTWK